MLLIPMSAMAGSNQMSVGMSFNLSNSGKVDLGSVHPWIRLKFSQPCPNSINKFRLTEMHHGYIGLGLVGSGYLLKSRILKVVGEILVIDDTIQHTLRIQTPVHLLNDKLWKYGWYRKIVTSI